MVPIGRSLLSTEQHVNVRVRLGLLGGGDLAVLVILIILFSISTGMMFVLLQQRLISSLLMFCQFNAYFLLIW